MSKFVDVIAALVMATLVAGIAFFSAPVWILLFPLRYVVGKNEAGDSPASAEIPLFSAGWPISLRRGGDWSAVCRYSLLWHAGERGRHSHRAVAGGVFLNR
jgi:hypothetical protein